MLIHISRARYDKIREAGWVHRGKARHPWRRYANSDTEFHILRTESGWCAHCNATFTSVDASTPAQLDHIRYDIAKEEHANNPPDRS